MSTEYRQDVESSRRQAARGAGERYPRVLGHRASGRQKDQRRVLCHGHSRQTTPMILWLANSFILPLSKTRDLPIGRTSKSTQLTSPSALHFSDSPIAAILLSQLYQWPLSSTSPQQEQATSPPSSCYSWALQIYSGYP